MTRINSWGDTGSRSANSSHKGHSTRSSRGDHSHNPEIAQRGNHNPGKYEIGGYDGPVRNGACDRNDGHV